MSKDYEIFYSNTPNAGPEIIRANNIATVKLAMLYVYETDRGQAPGSCLDPWEILPMMQCAMGSPPGHFVEVGVFKGGSAWHLIRLAKMQDRAIHLFDTFQGLVDYTPGIDILPEGLLNEAEAQLERVKEVLGPYPTYTKGTFPDVKLPPAGIAFAHIDVDQYVSTKRTIAALAPLMAVGGTMWFDDTGGATGGLEGARKAVAESFPEEAILIDPTTKRWLVVFA